jgi:peptidoglycan/xylan/chitin deacetylase (PgdA/CDA1 family)
VLKDGTVSDTEKRGVPLNISSNIFERQIKALAENGYKSIFFNEIVTLNSRENYIIITFDDGWQGNYTHCLPILKRYGFKAIFFISVGSVGSDQFMTWNEIIEMKNNGMAIESHAMSHTPLHTIKSKDTLSHELKASKDIIESKLDNQVTAISFPHGSYNQQIIMAAAEMGYDVMCTSDIRCIYNTSFNNKPAVVGRLPITNTMNLETFLKYVQYDDKEIVKLKLNKLLKKTIKNLIGINTYRFLYRKYFRINVH